MRKNANGHGRGGSSGSNSSSRPPPSLSPLRRMRTSSAPARIHHRPRRSLVDHYYRVDPDDRRLLPGLPGGEDDWERDLHDFFNLVSLVPVVVLNAMNWDCDRLWEILLDPYSAQTLEGAWVGDCFPLFFAVTVGYFLADLIWVTLVPQCVKSPGVIIQHHLATLLYLVIPYRFPEDRWLMGACLSVEVNTWLLIARRVVHKQGPRPTFFSIRTKVISVLFYTTWFFIRCYVYPVILRVFLMLWLAQWEETGDMFGSHYILALLLHSVFCLLNFKWTFDLLMSAWRSWGKPAQVGRGL